MDARGEAVRRLVMIVALSTLGLAVAGGGCRETETESDADVDGDVDGDADTDGDTDTDTDADSDVDADGDTDTDVDGDGDGDADSDVDGDTDADADADGPGPEGDHLLISELVVTPTEFEFFEIWNPTAASVDLDDYYVADNSAYARFATGVPWAPDETPGSDFLVGFPTGTTIGSGERLVVAMNDSFESTYSACPDFVVSDGGTGVACGTATVPAMVEPTNGGAGDSATLSNSREMLVLFYWDGDTSHVVEDVDYVTWGTDYDDATRVDKTSLTGYAADTARTDQDPATPPASTEAIGRCDAAEPGEASTGGNGMDGHDETSEDLGTSFRTLTSPSPGADNTCS